MEAPNLKEALRQLDLALDGSLHCDEISRTLYATDASVYRTMPLAVAVPFGKKDLVKLVEFARSWGVPITPRTAGTSLAGQAIGAGLVVDLSVHYSEILEWDPASEWVRVQPGVIRDELNRFLAPHGFFFGPNTSTTSRCMLGGMLGNNSSGTTSIRYGVTRDKVLEVEAILADGSEVVFGHLAPEEARIKAQLPGLEGQIYRFLIDQLSTPEVAREIRTAYPKPDIHRRNTGYALDAILEQALFTPSGPPFNLSKIIAGSEGTLCLVTAIKLKVDPLPPPNEAVVCAHFADIHQAMRATVAAMEYAPYACEVMDRTILDCTKDNLAQAENRFFVEGDPGAILAIELRHLDSDTLKAEVAALIARLVREGLGYAYPVVEPPDTSRVWELRAAGLGVLSNVKGDAKPLAFVEDTAVSLKDLPAYVLDFEAMMQRHGQRAVYYAHAGAGELHIRPVLNLKTAEGQDQFRRIGEETAQLVGSYGGSLSGEHGDGRARSEFIPMVLGEANARLIESIKDCWDPYGIFNPGVIARAVPMDEGFRYRAGQPPFAAATFLDFSDKGHILLAAEACNGSGDCRKPASSGATMCPSYQATRNEKDSTRARANLLREVLTRPDNPAYPMGSETLHEVLQLCLSCKACKRECPSSVDMALLKAEADYHYQRRYGFSRQAHFFGHYHRIAPWAAAVAPVANALLRMHVVAAAFKRAVGVAPQRSIPPFASRSGAGMARRYASKQEVDLLLYIDEFTQYQDAEVASAAAELLHGLGYRLKVVYAPSARAYMSKAMLPAARRTALQALQKLEAAAHPELPVVGLEPSAVLGFRDDLQALFKGEDKKRMQALGARSFTLEEFLSAEVDGGRLGPEAFTDAYQEVHLHLHCHQKSLSHVRHSVQLLSLPKGYQVTRIPSGCCGMAGSFGYEVDKFELSMQIGEQVLFPRVRSASEHALIVASGTSCRHQIKDGTGRKAIHFAQAMLRALKPAHQRST